MVVAGGGGDGVICNVFGCGDFRYLVVIFGGGGGSAVIFCLPVVIFWVGRNLSPEMVTGLWKK